MARHATVAGLLLIAQLSGCREGASVEPESPAVASEAPPPAKVTLKLGVLFAVKEASEKRILPEFRQKWLMTHGQEVAFETFYRGSHEAALDIAAGLEADVAVVSISTDLDEIARAGLIQGEWRARRKRGVFGRSVIVLAVRKGNPEGIRDWPDLRRPGIAVVMPDPETSGTGRSAVCAIHGAALRGYAGVGVGDHEEAVRFLASVLANVAPPDPSSRRCFKRFEEGFGDVAVTAESELIRGRMFGHEYERVIPRSTLLMEYFAAVVDANADPHGVRSAAEAFVEFLWSDSAQAALSFYGIRPVDETLAEQQAAQYPAAEDLWTIHDLGGWKQVSQEYFGEGGILERASASIDRGQ